jgi:DNA-binding PadR family transcriptional regulator
MSRVVELNATQGSLLGFLYDDPKTGWDLVREIEAGLGRFWNVTSSHVYRELRQLERSGLVTGGQPGARDRRPFAITPAGRRAFKRWIGEPPGHEQIRFPLLVKLWFARHVDADRLEAFFEAAAKDHEERLSLYRDVERSLDPGDDRTTVVRFGIAYEQAVLEWLDRTASPSAGRTVGTRGPGPGS